MDSFKRPFIHVFKEDLDFSIVIIHVMALDDVEVVYVSEDLDFPADLAANGVVVVAIDHLEGVVFTGGAVDNFVDSAACATAYSIHTLQLGKVEGLGKLGGGARSRG